MKNRKLVNFIVLFFCIIIASILISNQIFGMNTNKSNLYAPNKLYYNIEIESGVTLWDIAQEYMNDSYYDHASYIAEVVEINNIEGDTIYAGDTLTIPIFKQE